MKNILVIRMSALGDVAMTIPVIYSVAKYNPQITFTVLTQPFSANFFINPPSNVRIFKADTKAQYKGSKGILYLCNDLNKNRYDAIVDLHNVIRSKAIRAFFSLKGVKTVAIDKGRKEKKDLVSSDFNNIKPLKTSFERYADAFRRIGLQFELDFQSVYNNEKPQLNNPVIDNKDGKWVGIAPFAKHTGKTYPIDKCEEIIKTLSADNSIKILLFGADKEQKNILDSWVEKYDNTISLAGKLKISQEIELMSHLDLMVSMDSANMHFASLVNTPVISIWGATHPYAGFLGWNQKHENALGVDMECRPCSVYGNKACMRGDYPCMKELAVSHIINRIYKVMEIPV